MCGEKENEWNLWLPLATTLLVKKTPYEIVYNQPPPLHLPYLASESSNREVDRSMQRREAMISDLRFQTDQSSKQNEGL